MTTWEIVSIEAIPDITCVSTAGRVIPTQINTIIWEPTKDYIDAAGSKVPVTFRTPDTNNDYMTLTKLIGTCVFPESWSGNRYIVGCWAGELEVLRSRQIDVPPPFPENIVAMDLLTLIPDPTTCPLPFRWAGDFTWRLRLVGMFIILLYSMG